MMKWLWISVLTVVLDQLTKYFAEAELLLHKPVAVIPGFFNFTLMYNRGAAFSFLSDAGGWQRILFTGLSTVISIFLLFWLKQLSNDEEQKHNHILQIAITLILGGAIGNLIDRALTGEVVDFIQLYYSSYYFPAFNIADSAITVGAGLLILDMIMETRRSRND
ncbi:MAG: lipoprotein signal peptidase [Gammaproteobacteria bacterium]|nr:lipoprotein signal peptidase [Gammaproteobacteria bacterium]MBT8134673.1 lipoprotein signal peptidase [Gammaproteobacteria bacterium]NNJ50014.1 lipoprotein signal peptidase [Gammaproteobacteria bacterium]